MSRIALACPASLKGVLPAREAAAALVEGLGEGAVALPVADGGEGTLEVLHAALGGEWREAEVGDAFGRPRRARWLAVPDGGAGLREVLDELPAPTEALCDVRVPLLDAARLFSPQKGASPAQVEA